MSDFFQRLAPRLAAPPRIEPYPGWTLGAGERGVLPKLRRKVWRRLDRPVVVPWLQELALNIVPGNETCRSVFITGRYEPNEFSVLARILKPGMVFVDVGANLGLYSLFASRLVGAEGTVLALEPSSREFDQLSANLRLNALSNVRALQAAVSDRDGETDLLVAVAQHSGHNTTGRFAYENTELDHRERVATITLDRLVTSEKLSRLDVIKMDIEGGELAAICGAKESLARLHPMLLIEVADRSLRHQGASSAQLLDLICSYGYRLFAFSPKTGRPVPAERKSYYDSEDLLAVSGDSTPW
jgi:FkbM family methyltransferase